MLKGTDKNTNIFHFHPYFSAQVLKWSLIQIWHTKKTFNISYGYPFISHHVMPGFAANDDSGCSSHIAIFRKRGLFV